MLKEKKAPRAIDIKNCKRCGLCHGFCPQQVFTLAKDGTPRVTFPEKCINCRMCDLRCPDMAVIMEVIA